MHGHNSQSHICLLLTMERLHDADGSPNQEVVYNVFAVSVAFQSSTAHHIILKKEGEKK